jgi:hypothetical protein
MQVLSSDSRDVAKLQLRPMKNDRCQFYSPPCLWRASVLSDRSAQDRSKAKPDGFVAAVWWIRKHNSGLWTRRIWIGVALGLMTGVVVHLANRLPLVPTLVDMFEPWPLAAVLTAALSTLGGVIAKLTGSQWHRSAGDVCRSQKQPP